MNKKGFTLVELLITIAILAILVGIAVPTYLGQQRKAAMTEAVSKLQNLRLLEEQFYAENGRYAPGATCNGIVTVSPSFYNINFDTLTNPNSPSNIIVCLRGFRPGNAVDLYYDYTIYNPAQLLNSGTCASAGNDPNAPAGASFTACAMPKAGTIVANSAALWINDRNQNNF
ncbi:MAG: prepilin-type N-terminal cleavage/methylation domain-containing protein [Nitrospiraceae bacterium]|nr:prepilin-type N-terminal cleavage/methylation domain-containing protein [Nitrospiraceae bacterium]